MKTILLQMGALLVLVISMGCATQHESASTAFPAPPQLDRKAKVYIPKPEPGRDGDEIYKESATQTQDALLTEAKKYFAGVVAGIQPMSPEQEVEAAKNKGCLYVISPNITRWSDYETEWTGTRDKLEIVMEIVDPNSSELLHRTKLVGRSSWATLGGDHPEDMLPGMMTNYFTNLFPTVTAAQSNTPTH